MATLIDVQLSFDGPSPIVTGDKRLTLLNLARLLNAINHGSQYRKAASSPYVQVTPTMVAASATCTCATVVANNTVTIAGTALTATQKRATGTLTAASVIADTTCVINGVTFTAVDDTVTLGDATFDCSGTDTECATSLAAQINAYVDPRITGVVAARSAAAICTVYAVNQGTAGNAYTLVGTAVVLAASAATLANGAALSNNTFDFAGTNATTADALAYAINNSTTAAIQRVTAVSDGVDVVTISGKFLGDAGEVITLTSSGATLTVTGSGFLASGSQGATTRWTF